MGLLEDATRGCGIEEWNPEAGMKYSYDAKAILVAMRCFEIKTEEARSMVTQLDVLRGETSSAHEGVYSDFSEPQALHLTVVLMI